jgi:transposase
MIINNEQFKRISRHLPLQRGNVRIDNLTVVNAILYIAENGCKWRALPSCYGKWYTVYKRVSRWAKNGVLERLFLALQKEQIAVINVEILALDSTCAKVHPDGCGALKKTADKPSEKPVEVGTPSFMWFPSMTKSFLR